MTDFEKIRLQLRVQLLLDYQYFTHFFPLRSQIYLTNLARPGQWIFSEELFTDQNEVKVIVDTIFSKLLDHVPYEVPYNVKIQIEYFDVADDGMQMQ